MTTTVDRTAAATGASGPLPLRLAFGTGPDGGSLVELDVDAAGAVRLVRCSALDRPVPALGPASPALPLVELGIAGAGSLPGGTPNDRHQKGEVGARLRYVDARVITVAGDERAPYGTRATLLVRLADPRTGLEVDVRVEQHDDIPVLRATTEVRNAGADVQVLTYVSSFVHAGFAAAGDVRWDEALRVGVVHSGWCGELRWQERTLPELGLRDLGLAARGHDSSRKRFAVTARGSWSSADHLPMGSIRSTATGETWVWQVEHNGAWHWEVGDKRGDLALAVSGPTDAEHAWRRRLLPGTSFTSVPVAVALATDDGRGGGLHAGLRALTRHRRATRRPHPDHATLPVVFNDYMNCLDGDPTTERLLPLVDAAAEVGAEVFCVDAGWYADGGGWWDEVGAWEPSAHRFPGGLDEVMAAVRARGMVPGLWLEPEVVGVRSPVVGTLPPDALFHRDGVAVVESGRHQLDLRHPAVVARLDAVVDRLVRDYGVGYLKLDHNINAGAGTEVAADSPGDGLLEHNRAHLAWLDALLDRHPGLVVENCAGGGMRMDHALLSRAQVQSTSDQRDHVATAAIAAAAPSGVTPEQGGVWAYPQAEMGDEELALCLVDAMLGRVHLSGRLDRLDERQRGLVREALAVYRSYRARLPRALPSWPLGLPQWDDPWLALALHDGEDTWVAVWRRGGERSVTLPVLDAGGPARTASVLFPRDLGGRVDLDAASGRLHVDLPTAPSARLVHLAAPAEPEAAP